MKIVYILGQDTGGLPHYTAELANAVAKRADVVVVKPSETTADELFADAVDVRETFAPIDVSMPKLYDLDVDPIKFTRGIVSYDNLKEIREIDADITHDASGLFPQVRFFTRLHGIDELRPFVVTQHEVPRNRFSLARPPVLVEEVVNYLLPNVNKDRIVVHTDEQKRALIDRGKRPESIEVVPHGAYSVFGSDADLDTEPEDDTVLFFGNVIPPKGPDVLVEAIPMVKREIPDVTLILAGDGDLSARSRSIVQAHEENFELHNYFIPNEDVKRLFARAEVVALPYRTQDGTKGHSGVLSAAYSFGKPVVATTAGEFPTQVGETGCGLVVPPEDPRRLADAITQVLDDDDRKEEMAANSLRMAERLSWDNVAERYLDVYNDVLDGDGQSTGATISETPLPGSR